MDLSCVDRLQRVLYRVQFVVSEKVVALLERIDDNHIMNDKQQQLLLNISEAFRQYREQFLQDTPGIWTDQDIWDEFLEEVTESTDEVINSCAS